MTCIIGVRSLSGRNLLLRSSKHFFNSNSQDKVLKSVAKMSSNVDTIRTVDFDYVKSLKDNSKIYLIDVREPNELKETGTIPGSISIPLGEVQEAFSSAAETFEKKYQREKPATGTEIVFSCRSGRRSEMAANTTIQLGYKNVANYSGGWLDWESKIKT